jgi:integrase
VVSLNQMEEWVAAAYATFSPNTILIYQDAVRRLWKCQPNLDLTTLSPAEVRSLYATCGLPLQSLAHYDKAWRAVFARLEREGGKQLGIEAGWRSPWRDVEKVRWKAEEEVALDSRELSKVLRVKQTFKRRTFVKLLATTGLRVSEALALGPEDVQGQRLRVFGKGRKWRWVYMPVDMAEDMQVMALGALGERLWKWSRQYAYEVVRETGDEAGVKGLHPHRLRHTYASILLNQKGAPLKFVQQQLGHSSSLTTMRYVHLHPEQAAELADKFRV